MKNLFFSVLKMTVLSVLCLSCTKDVIPSVELKEVGVSETSVSFSVMAEKAEAVWYDIAPKGNDAMTSSMLVESGTKVEPPYQDNYEITGLDPETEYVIYAVAQSETGNKSGVAVLSVTTSKEILPEVEITLVSSTENSITFTVKSENASEVRYTHVGADDTLPSAEDILSNGISVNAIDGQECVIENLEPGTEYVIVAAGKDDKGKYSEVANLKASTQEHVPVVPAISIISTSVELNEVTVGYTSDKAVKCAYVVNEASVEMPDAESILSSGTELPSDSDEVVVGNLLYETSYYIAMAAVSEDGTYSEVASSEFVTEEEPVVYPQVGDYYYSDGTFSSGSGDPVSGKTVIGVVFYSGRNSSDATEYKNLNAGTIENVMGYAVALEGAYYETDSFFNPKKDSYYWAGDFILAGASTDITKFNGYENTIAIYNKAVEKYGELNDTWNNFLACYAAYTSWSSIVPAPETSSGWFFPSVAELKALIENYEAVEASIEKAGGKKFTGIETQLWASNECADNPTSYVYTVDVDPSSNLGSEIKTKKDRSYGTRSIIVF